MSELKKWAYELALCTIVAGTVTLLSWGIGLDRTWNDAAQTFFIAFIVMTALGIWRTLRGNNKE